MKSNHFENVCKSPVAVNNVLDKSSSEEEENEHDINIITISRSSEVNSIDNGVTSNGKSSCYQVKPAKSTMKKIKLNGSNISVQIDSGSDVNIISENDMLRLKEKPHMSATKIKLYPFASNRPIPLLGKFTGVVETATKFEPVTFYVVPKEHYVISNILGANTSMKLGILKIEGKLSSNYSFND